MKQLALEGDCRFSLGRDSVSVHVDRISNNRSGGVSGTLAVKLWALEAPAGNGSLRGRVVASKKLSPLDGGSSIRNFDETTEATDIPSGYYFPAITLEERDSSVASGWYVADMVQFDQPTFFGRRLAVSELSVTSSSPSSVVLKVAELRNETPGPTGPLRVSLWATREPYRGGAIRGYRLDSRELDALPGGKSRRDLEWTLSRNAASEAARFAVLLVEERRIDGQNDWQLREYSSVDLPPLGTSPPAELAAREPVPTPTEVEIKEEDLIGQRRAKTALGQVIALARVNEERRRRGLKTPKVTLHAAFTGSPGTGKTTFARFYTQQIRGLGLLERGHLVEVSRPDLVAEYSGQTASKTAKVIDSALGGVLFIDEAYALKTGKDDSYGKECIDTIVKMMEDHRDELVVIFAGYTAEMREFLRQNAGLESRVPNVIEFDDFDDMELGLILESFCKREGVSVAPEVRAYAVEQVATRRRGRSFGNARDVRSLFERALAKQAMRLGPRDLNAVSPEELSGLIRSDFAPDSDASSSEPERVREPSSALESVLGLVGLQSIKNDMRETAALIRVERVRQRGRGLPAVGLNRLYAGAPGTGKRTVAGFYAAFLRELGLLARGHVTEVSRPDLIAGYIGQTSLKARERIADAMGGVLYVNDAPSLWLRGERYDQDAIEVILEAADVHRERIVVILSGEAADVTRMFVVDPRLRRVFPEPLDFEAPSIEELLEIARRLADSRGNRLSDAATTQLRAQIEAARSGSAPFSNATQVRDFLERAYTRRAIRLEAVGDIERLDPDLLHLLEREDFVSQNA